MRAPLDAAKVRDLLRALGNAARGPGRIYLTGGTSAVLEGWRERSRFIERHGSVEFYHYDFYGQALAKIERGHDRDRTDVRAMFQRKLVEAAELRSLFTRIEPELPRYPAIDPDVFRSKIDEAIPEAGRD